MHNPELLAIPVGFVAIGVIALRSGWRSVLAAALLAAIVLFVLWFTTVSPIVCAAGDDMCQRALGVWDVYRMAVIGGPGVLVGIAFMWKLMALLKRRYRAEVEAVGNERVD